MPRNPDKTTPQEAIGALLRGSSKTLCAAESCTGGLISHSITTIPGASEYYLGSVTSYAVRIKERLLNVPAQPVESNGIVSSEVARAMAEGVRALMHSTYSVATTGWADAYGDEHEPAGTCWIAVSGPLGTRAKKSSSHRGRVTNIRHFARTALRFLADYITEAEDLGL